MVKTSVRGKGTRGGGSASGGNGRGGGAGRGKEPAGERGASGGGGSGRGLSVGAGCGRGGAGGKGPAPEYIPLGELAAIAAGRTAKSRGKGILQITGGNLTISPPSGSQNRSTASRDKDGGGSSSPMDAGETQTPGRKRANSSHDSNVSSRPSPPSHGTHHSTGNESISGTLPRQYPPSSNRDQPLPTLRRTNLNLNIQPRQQLQVENHVQEEEEDDEGDEEEQDDDDIEPDDIDHEEQDGDDQDAVNGEDVDYDQLLADVMADPGRQSLPLLSEQPHPERDTIW